MSVAATGWRAAAAAAALGLLAGCTGEGGEAPAAAAPPAAAGGGAGPAPAPATAAPALGRPDARGVAVFEDYAVIIAREGDSLEAMAARAGVPASELAAYNGLPVNWTPRGGDELVLPPRPGGYAPGPAAAAPAPAPMEAERMAAPEGTPLSVDPPGRAVAGAAVDPAAPAADISPGWSPERIGAALEGGPPAAAPSAVPDGEGVFREVAYHDVAEGETVYSIARAYGVPPETVIAWNALSGPDYRVTPGQVLTIPAGRAPAPGDAGLPPVSVPPPGAAGPATPPPGAAEALPPEPVAPRPLESPELGRYRTEASRPAARPVEAEAAPPGPAPAAPAPAELAAAEPPRPAEGAGLAARGRMLRPHPGEIARDFNREPGAARNDGVDFAAQPGDTVVAAADGEVALVSTSLGEWGTIVLLRHDDRVMTVYGRLGEATVRKGDRVRAGQVVGRVAAPESGRARLHFEVRRGAFSEDPREWLVGG